MRQEQLRTLMSPTLAPILLWINLHSFSICLVGGAVRGSEARKRGTTLSMLQWQPQRLRKGLTDIEQRLSMYHHTHTQCPCVVWQYCIMHGYMEKEFVLYH